MEGGIVNKRKITVITSILFWLLLSGFGNSVQIDSHAIDVTIINLIATPEKYHNKKVRVIGVVNIQFEGTGIYLNKEHHKYRLPKYAVCMNAIDLKAIGKSAEELEKYNGQYVVVEGKFDKDHDGHMGMSSGCIFDITRYSPWED